MYSVHDKVILLTGASEGIGRALALELARRGASLCVVARNAARLETLADECRAAGAAVATCRADVADETDCRRMIAETIEHFGRLDVLINNAGVTMWSRADALTDLGVYEHLMRVNYLGCVYSTLHALDHLKASGGLIVTVASIAGLTGVPERTGYAASKHAVFGFFDSLRIELDGTGVDVTMIAPDFVVSEIHKRALDADGKPLGKSPMNEGRIMTAARCAELIVEAIEKRRRLAILSLRGRLGRWARLVAPGLIDRIARNAIRAGH